jgi:hypothetical protein
MCKTAARERCVVTRQYWAAAAGIAMNLKSACLQTAALYRELAASDEQHRALYLAEAERWEARADTEIRLLISFERKPLIQGQGSERRKQKDARRRIGF